MFVWITQHLKGLSRGSDGVSFHGTARVMSDLGWVFPDFWTFDMSHQCKCPPASPSVLLGFRLRAAGRA